jgi:ferredoxin-type protein NapF
MSKRRELFSSLAFTKKKQGSFEVRPPYYKNGSDFSNCINCDGKCATVCEENIIFIKEDKTPVINFLKSGCTYCDKCALACEYDVLKLEDKNLINAKFEIDMLKCLSWQKTMCFSCKEICLDDAVEFLGLFRADINYEKCTNCGFCVKVCPTEAIKVKQWQ